MHPGRVSSSELWVGVILLEVPNRGGSLVCRVAQQLWVVGVMTCTAGAGHMKREAHGCCQLFTALSRATRSQPTVSVKATTPAVC